MAGCGRFRAAMRSWLRGLWGARKSGRGSSAGAKGAAALMAAAAALVVTEGSARRVEQGGE